MSDFNVYLFTAFPKKYNPKLHGTKDSYSVYENNGNSALNAPEETSYLQFEGLLQEPLQVPGTSYDAFESEPVDPLFVPEEYGSSYSGYSKGNPEPMLPPPIDSYINADGERVDIILAPAEGQETEPEAVSYIVYSGEPEYPLTAPKQSSYAVKSEDRGSDVLSSLVTMVRSLPIPSSYSEYAKESSSFSLSPPAEEPEEVAAESKISYSVIPPAETPLTAEDTEALKKAGVKVPSSVLVAPPKQNA